MMRGMIKDILTHKSLIRQLVLKDLKTRYSRPMLGFFWAFLSPFLTVAIFYVIFSVILKVQIEGMPFFLYLMSAIFPWFFFQDSILASAASLLNNKNLIRESNFPHYLIPMSIVIANMINFLPSLALVIAASLFVLKGLPLLILLLPAVLLVQLAITIGLSIVISVSYVKYRDLKYIVEAVLLLVFYLTPFFYSIRLVKVSFPPALFNLYACNPFVGLLNLYRITILKGFQMNAENYLNPLFLVVVPAAFAAAALFAGLWFYHKQKDTINDYISY